MSQSDPNDAVVVLDSDSQCGLSVIRSLGKKGVSVTAGSRRRRSLGARSRFSDDSFVHPDPAEDRNAFVHHLLTYLEDSDHVAVIPVEDHTSLILAKHKPTFEQTGTVVATEDWETFELAFDKGKLFEGLTDVAVPAPATYTPTSEDQVANLADDIQYPVVVKPRCKSQLTENGYTISLVTEENYVHSATELQRTFRRTVRRNAGSGKRYPIIQEYVPGTTTTTVALADNGDVLTYFQEERLRTYPSSGGNSALLRARSDPLMLDFAERVLDHLEWTGPAMVEFMRTPAGEYYVIEVNGRYWGSLPFAIGCGVDFPWFHYLQLSGIDPAPLIDFGTYRTNFRQRRLLYEDIKWLGEHLSRGNVAALGPFLTAFFRARHTAVDLGDPIPMVAAFSQAARLGAQSVLGRVTDAPG